LSYPGYGVGGGVVIIFVSQVHCDVKILCWVQIIVHVQSDDYHKYAFIFSPVIVKYHLSTYWIQNKIF